MTGGTGYAFAALVCYGLGDFIYKNATVAGVKPHHFLMGQAWCFTPTIVVYAWATGTLVVGPSSAWGGLAGLFIFIAFYNFLRSLAGGSVSISAPVFRLNFLITALLAITLLGEPIRLAMPIALVLALAAIWLLLGGSEPGKRPEIDRRALGAVLIATLALGIGNFCHTVGLRQGGLPETLLVSQAAVFVVLSTAFVRIVDGKIAPPRMIWKHTAAAAAVLIVAFLFMLHGVARGPASVLVPIAQMGFVVTAALGIVVLREPMTPRKAAGLAAALGALAALAATAYF
jgi:drug/metabolite transporter (DMT)-like permease